MERREDRRWWARPVAAAAGALCVVGCTSSSGELGPSSVGKEASVTVCDAWTGNLKRVKSDSTRYQSDILDCASPLVITRSAVCEGGMNDHEAVVVRRKEADPSEVVQRLGRLGFVVDGRCDADPTAPVGIYGHPGQSGSRALSTASNGTIVAAECWVEGEEVRDLQAGLSTTDGRASDTWVNVSFETRDGQPSGGYIPAIYLRSGEDTDITAVPPCSAPQ